MIDETKMMQYVALGMVATFLFVGGMLFLAIDGIN
jgi:hypothetical protein